MTEQRSFYRKLIYGVAIGLLLIPLSLLSRPATVDEQGGKLAQLRENYGLSQADLGEVDPASETIKLATLGLRGVAVNMLWSKANEYKKKEDWTNLTATLEQLAKLQPNFLTFWKYQSWNLSYNVSVEFDDYHDRYYYVRRGLQFLEQGQRYNRNSRDIPQLLWELGWFTGQKVGRADEKVQYRRLFKADDEYHPPDRAPRDRDNWLVSKMWYDQGTEAVDTGGASYGRKSPVVFFSSPAKSQMSYGEAIEDDALFEVGREAWKIAAGLWRDFGDRDILHSTGVALNLNDEDELEKQTNELRKQLLDMRPNVREEMVADIKKALTTEQQAVLDKPFDKLAGAEQQLYYELQDKLDVTDDEIAIRLAELEPTRKREILKLAADLRDTHRQYSYTGNYKDNANFDYWMTRAEFEQTDDAVAARKLLHQARRALRDDGDPASSRKLYEQSFDRWVKVLETFPTLRDPEGTTGDDLMEYIKEYKDVLDQLDEPLADDFPLWDIIENFDSEMDFQEDIIARKQRLDAQGGAPPADPPAAQ